MKRREFLHKAAVYGATSAIAPALLFSSGKAAEPRDILAGVQIIDAHAHPDMGERWKDNSASYRYMQQGAIMTSSFSVVGDELFLRGIAGSEYHNTKGRLEYWLNGLVRERKITLVRSARDVPETRGTEYTPGAILSIEGADALDGRLDRLDNFYHMGVRIITLIHYRNNEVGDVMRAVPGQDPGPFRGTLTDFGRKVIARMEQLGMVVDVAHASSATLKDILLAARKPVIDSHTSLYWKEAGGAPGRLRTWQEIELIAQNGGVICTWPKSGYARKTLADWAKEIVLLKQRIGIKHIALGTDLGGSLPGLVSGYSDERDNAALAKALLNAGLSQEDIAAFMGGNMLRILKQCIG